MGYRGRRGGRYPGYGPFRDLPPWQRPGWIYGYGAGYGRGAAYLTDPTRCARFPWLPRWWWSNPDYQGTVPAPPPAFSPDQEKQFLEGQVKFLEKELEEIRKRLEDMASSKEQET